MFQIFVDRYKMTVGAWGRLFALSIAINILAIVVPVALLFSPLPGGSVFVVLIGVPLGIGIAVGPALLTVLIASVFAHLRGYFSFWQFAVIGTLVSSAIAARAIIGGNDLLLDHIFTLMFILPFAWCFGWLAAHFSNVLPSPLPAGDFAQTRVGVIGRTGISALLVVIPFIALWIYALDARGDRALAREVERRGICPDGLECVVYGAAKEAPDAPVYVAHLDGQQFVLAGDSIRYGIKNQTPGDVGEISLIGLLPSFASRSASDDEAFAFPYENVALNSP